MKIINDFKESIKILFSKEFRKEFKQCYKEFKHYYSGKEIVKRLDAYAEKMKNRNKINKDI